MLAGKFAVSVEWDRIIPSTYKCDLFLVLWLLIIAVVVFIVEYK